MSTHPSHERRIAELESELSEAMPFYERAPHKIPDRPLPIAESAPGTSGRAADRASLVQGAASENSTATRRRPTVPRYVLQVLDYIEKNNQAPEGYEGGREFLNLGKGGDQSLRNFDDSGNSIKYREWDVHRQAERKNRGAERLVTGSDGRAYYTSDHYQTFLRIR